MMVNICCTVETLSVIVIVNSFIKSVYHLQSMAGDLKFHSPVLCWSLSCVIVFLTLHSVCSYSSHSYLFSASSAPFSTTLFFPNLSLAIEQASTRSLSLLEDLGSFFTTKYFAFLSLSFQL